MHELNLTTEEALESLPVADKLEMALGSAPTESLSEADIINCISALQQHEAL